MPQLSLDRSLAICMLHKRMTYNIKHMHLIQAPISFASVCALCQTSRTTGTDTGGSDIGFAPLQLFNTMVGAVLEVGVCPSGVTLLTRLFTLEAPTEAARPLARDLCCTLAKALYRNNVKFAVRCDPVSAVAQAAPALSQATLCLPECCGCCALCRLQNSRSACSAAISLGQLAYNFRAHAP